MATSWFQRSWVHIHSSIPRALCQRTTRNIDMAVEPEEGGKLGHWRLQPTLPVRAKPRRQTITSDGTPGLLCLSNPSRRQTAIFFLLKGELFRPGNLVNHTRGKNGPKTNTEGLSASSSDTPLQKG
jgi:hypothetical protein